METNTITQTNVIEDLKKKREEKKETTIHPVHIGIVEAILPTTSKFGFAWRIKLSHGSWYYLNGSSENLAEKLFKVGNKAAFTCKERTAVDGRTFRTIDVVLQTF